MAGHWQSSLINTSGERLLTVGDECTWWGSGESSLINTFCSDYNWKQNIYDNYNVSGIHTFVITHPTHTHIHTHPDIHPHTCHDTPNTHTYSLCTQWSSRFFALVMDVNYIHLCSTRVLRTKPTYSGDGWDIASMYPALPES